MHQELTLFLDMIQSVIDNKRKRIQEKNVTDISTNPNEVLEKDLLEMMLEAGEEGDGTLSDELLQVKL